MKISVEELRYLSEQVSALMKLRERYVPGPRTTTDSYLVPDSRKSTLGNGYDGEEKN